MKMYENSLNRAWNLMYSVDQLPQPPSTSIAIEELKDRVKSILNFIIPEDYLTFLTISNGFSWNGVEIYASYPSELLDTITNRQPEVIEGFLEANLKWQQASAYFENYILFGKIDSELLVYSLLDKSYGILDPIGGDLIEKVSSFEELLNSVLKARA